MNFLFFSTSLNCTVVGNFDPLLAFPLHLCYSIKAKNARICGVLANTMREFETFLT